MFIYTRYQHVQLIYNFHVHVGYLSYITFTDYVVHTNTQKTEIGKHNV